MEDKKVRDVYKAVDFNWMHDKAETSDYWKNALKFATENWEMNVGSITAKQANWLSKIEKDCVEKK